MSINTLSQVNQSITLERNKVITLTQRTVRFGSEVYQTHNIAGFGEGEVNIGAVPWIILIIALFLGWIGNSINPAIGWVLILASIGGVVWNFVKPKHYGFLITLNSGDKKLFTTSDKPGLKQVTSIIYELIETDKEATYQISVNNSQIHGNFVQGYAEGNLSFND